MDFINYLGESKSSAGGIAIPYKQSWETFCLYSLQEKEMPYFSMLFDHSWTNMIKIKYW